MFRQEFTEASSTSQSGLSASGKYAVKQQFSAGAFCCEKGVVTGQTPLAISTNSPAKFYTINVSALVDLYMPIIAGSDEINSIPPKVVVERPSAKSAIP